MTNEVQKFKEYLREGGYRLEIAISDLHEDIITITHGSKVIYREEIKDFDSAEDELGPPQLVLINVPPTLPPGHYAMKVGEYDPLTHSIGCYLIHSSVEKPKPTPEDKFKDAFQLKGPR